ncbi:hypothetical protein [Cecembia calidifontis]|uniref:Membrane-bound lysozyme inhibitor of c-type lysozyme MliC n=1 Tax=Cecembia calidifontis TaxID=1187080 RepID=A0A4Q7PEI6_9BACT|nr:hypothetical protein [Cecembia calidifontis]RZS98705.1 hypothetical protein BC751_4371 [Cecembia calidifontis]
MKKGILLLFIFAGVSSACMEIEEISGPCEITILLADGSTRFYEISEDIRRNKKTGVFTYRDENGRLWSTTQDEQGNWFSKSAENGINEVLSISCGDKVYFQKEEEDTGND